MFSSNSISLTNTELISQNVIFWKFLKICYISFGYCVNIPTLVFGCNLKPGINMNISFLRHSDHFLSPGTMNKQEK